jgi:thiol-disulfide isomerase/thioredoxin
MNRTFVALLAAGLSVGIANAQNVTTKAQPAGKTETKAAEPVKAKTLAELFPAEAATSALTVGSKAPELKISQWVRGTPVSGFEKGRVYVVEFWATWCGPCIAAFPHLAELQAKHSDKLTVIGVNIWENKEGQERIDLVNEFVAKHTEMAYTVALEEGTAMADNWMKAAGRNGIPSAFIVNGDGQIAWMGHPMGMDESLEKIIAGTHDIEAAKQELANEQRTMVAYTAMNKALQEKSWDRAHEIANALVNETFSDNIGGLNAVGWMLSSPEDASPACLKLAHKAAKMANEQTEWKEWMLMSTYAQASFRMGDKAEAVKWLNKAIELAPAEYRGDLNERLATYGAQG